MDGTYEKQVQDMEDLLTACEGREEVRRETAALRATLGGVLLDVKGTKHAQETHRACQLEATQRLRELMGRARESARRLRSLVRAHLGTTNELLVEFNVAPIRKRGRRKVRRPAAG